MKGLTDLYLPSHRRTQVAASEDLQCITDERGWALWNLNLGKFLPSFLAFYSNFMQGTLKSKTRTKLELNTDLLKTIMYLRPTQVETQVKHRLRGLFWDWSCQLL